MNLRKWLIALVSATLCLPLIHSGNLVLGLIVAFVINLAINYQVNKVRSSTPAPAAQEPERSPHERL